MVFRDPTHHSGAQIQDWTYKNHAQVSAQVLMGAGLLRKYRNGTVSTNYPTPTLVRLLCACFSGGSLGCGLATWAGSLHPLAAPAP